MKSSKDDQQFHNSLDLTDAELEEHVPYLLQDLQELGSLPVHIISLIKENLMIVASKTVVDFGCGKGAVLIQMAEHFGFRGTGYDLVPEFVEMAEKVRMAKAMDHIQFECADILKVLPQTNAVDILIYGHDSELLGDVSTTLEKLSGCICDSGHLLLEVPFTENGLQKLEGIPDKEELIKAIANSRYIPIDHVLWSRSEIKSMNDNNNEFINKRINELKLKYPQKAGLFDQYYQNQLEECSQLENLMNCSTWLLEKKL